jgi:hypothetical protein
MPKRPWRGADTIASAGDTARRKLRLDEVRLP